MPPTPSPTDERLRDTIAKRMRMSHVDQHLMLMELLGRRSPAPAPTDWRAAHKVADQDRCCQRRGSWRPCRAITRISGPSSGKYTA
jgi:hypothetical protein